MLKVRNNFREMILPEGHSLFKQCHASTLVEMPDGDILIAYFAGTREGTPDTAIWLNRRRKGEWLSPEIAVNHPNEAHWNPVLHLDGSRLWLFYKLGDTVPSWTSWYVTSEDGGITWSHPHELMPGETVTRGPGRTKMLVASNGSWIAPNSIEGEHYWDAFVDISANKGQSWDRVDIPFKHLPLNQLNVEVNEQQMWEGLKEEALWENDLSTVFKWDGIIQPALWESEPGHIHMLLRSTRGRIYRSDSEDAGRTWSEAYATDLPNNNSGVDVVKMKDGQLALIYNPVSGNWSARSPISISFSENNGRSWSEPFHLEADPGEFSYPAMIEADGKLHISYTWNRTNFVYHGLEVEES